MVVSGRFLALSRWGVLGLRRGMASAVLPQFDFLTLSRPTTNVVHVELNRPDKRNALNLKLWREIGACFDHLSDDADCRSVVLSGRGKLFCAGIDLSDLMSFATITNDDSIDVSRRAKKLQKLIEEYQGYFTSIEKCSKPVIAAVHGGCLGGGMGILTACDIRYSTEDAYFSIKEVMMGFVGDVGHMQRLPKIMGSDGLIRELAFTGRNLTSDEAFQHGLITRRFGEKGAMIDECLRLASDIAERSPVGVQACKAHLNWMRNHSVNDGLDYVALWNSLHIQSEDVVKSAMAQISKSEEAPDFEPY